MRTRTRILARRSSGFTLLEVMVAMLLAVIIMTTVHFALYGTLFARDTIDQEMAGVNVGPTILDLVERDLNSLHLFNVEGNRVLKGQSQTLGGRDADQIDFIADVTSSTTQQKVLDENQKTRSPVTEVGYRLRTNPDNPDFLELWRRQDFFVDNLPFEGGTYEKIYSQVKKFHVGYYEKLDEDKEEVRDWDVAEKGALPAAMVITIDLEVEPRRDGVTYTLDEQRRRTYTFTRTIMLARDSELAMRLKPLIPDLHQVMTTKDGGEDSADGNGIGGGGGSLADGGGGREGSFEHREGGRFGDGTDGGLKKIGGTTDRMRMGGGKGGLGGPGGLGGLHGRPGGGDLSPDDKNFLDQFFKQWLGKK